jgi:trehalose/maltose transport system substrate-binding protein
MRKAILGVTATVAMTVSGMASAATLSIACGSVGQEYEVCKQGAETWAKQNGHTIRMVSVPADANEQLTFFQQLLSAKSADLDVVRIDVIWTGLLSQHLVDLKPHVPQDELGRFFKPLVRNNTVDGKLVALPWFTDAGILYYRKDLLEKYKQQVPTTWQELATVARTVADGERKAGNAKMQGFVFQAKAAESLTCNALEWIDSFGGGTVVDETGKVTINNPKAAEALTFFASLVGTVAPKGVLNYSEEESRGVFQSGQAVFMRNWPYAWALANAKDSPVKDKVGVAALPKGGPEGKHTGTLGGWQLSVSSYSKNQEAAISLAKYLTSAQEQKRRAVVASFNPTRPDLYKDPEVLKANPFFSHLQDVFTNAVARPSKMTRGKYSQLSSEFRNAVHATLSGRSPAADNLEALEGKLNRLSRNGKW